MRPLPFSFFSGDITSDDESNEGSISDQNEVTSSDVITPSNPVNNNVNSANSSVVAATCSSTINNSTKVNPKRKNISCPKNRIKKAKSSKSVYFDQFLEIECSYLYPNELDDKYLAKDNSEFVAFHNNVRSMNKNFHKVDDVFQNCWQKPDILAFSDTQIWESSSKMPKTPNGYHDFVFTESSTQAGGVGFYLIKSFDYKLCPDFSLDLNLCEDL